MTNQSSNPEPDEYSFRLVYGRGGGLTSDEPPFVVDLGGFPEAVGYTEPGQDKIILGAIRKGRVISVSTRRLAQQIKRLPPGMTLEEYMELIKQRLIAAGNFSGPDRRVEVRFIE